MSVNVRYLAKPEVHGQTSRFNTMGLGEVIVYFEDGSADSVPTRELEVLLSNGTWKNMARAFRDRDLLPDNYNEYFVESKYASPEEIQQGWVD